MLDEVLEGGFRHCELGCVLSHRSDTPKLVGIALGSTVHVGVHVLACLLDVTGNVEGISGIFGDGETVVQGNTCWDSTESAVLC